MSIDAVALLRIPNWEPDDELDTRALDDAHLLYLEIPFESEPDAIAEAIVSQVGEALAHHDDERGIFVLPDAADPDDAKTYEAVLAEVGEVGMWLHPADEGPVDMHGVLSNGVRSVLDDALSAMGIGGVEEMQRLLQEGDPDKLKLMSIRMQSAFEEAARPPEEKPAQKSEPQALPDKPKSS